MNTIERCAICGLLHTISIDNPCSYNNWPVWWNKLSLDNRLRYYEYTSNTKSANEFVDKIIAWREYLIKRGDSEELK